MVSGNHPTVKASSVSTTDTPANPHNVDLLFDRTFDKSVWEPPKAPQVLGELLDSRHMLPLFLPSDPRKLSASPIKTHVPEYARRLTDCQFDGRGPIQLKSQGPMEWICRSQRVRGVSTKTLQWMDGLTPSSCRGRPLEMHYTDEPSSSSSDIEDLRIDTNIPRASSQSTPLTRKPSARSRARLSLGGDQLSPLVAL